MRNEPIEGRWPGRGRAARTMLAAPLVSLLLAAPALAQTWDVTAFGAACDGLTDDRAAIQATLDAASAAGGGTVVLPPGVCSVEGGLSVDGDIWLAGAGPDQSLLKLAAGAYVGALTFVRFQSVGSGGLRDLTLDASWFGVTGAAIVGVAVPGAQEVTLERAGVRYRQALGLGADGLEVIDFFAARVDQPTLSVLVREPSAPTVYNDTSPAVVIDASGADLGAMSTTLRVDVDGVDVTASCVATGSTATCEAPVLAAGPHTVSAQVTDGALRHATASQSFDLVLDAAPPTLTVIQPPPAVELGMDSTAVIGYSDLDSGVDLGTLEVRNNGFLLAAVHCDPGAAAATCNLIFNSLGSNTIDVTLADAAGNVALLGYPFEIEDTVPPTVAIVAPVDGRQYETSPDIEVEHSDAGSGVDNGAFVLEIDGGDQTATCSFFPDLECSGDWGFGVHTAVARSFDEAGNQASASVTFEVVEEMVPPEVEMLYLGGDPPFFRVNYNDRGEVGSGSFVDRDTLMADVDGQDITPSCSPTAFYAICQSASLASGRHTASASVADNNGNVGGDSVTFDVNPAGAPAVSIDKAAIAVLYNDTTPAFVVSYSDADPGLDLATLVVEVDGVDVTATGCTVGASSASCEAPLLAAGTHTIAARIADLAASSGSAVWAFDLVFDTTAPALAIIEPGAQVENNLRPEIVLAYSDTGSGVDVSRVDAAYSTGTSLFCSPVGVTRALCKANFNHQLQSYTVDATVEDMAGNVAMASHTFAIVDTRPPSVDFMEPTAPRIDSDLSPPIRVTSDDPQATLTLTIDGIDRSADCVGFWCEAEWGVGPHTAVATLTDASGNAGTASRGFEVVFETVAPEIAITPAPGSVITTAVPEAFVVSYADRGELSAGGIGLDPGSFALELDGVDITWRCNQGTDTAVCSSPGLAPGPHLLEARIRDLNGNQGALQSDFELAIEEARIEILKPGGFTSPLDPEIWIRYSEPVAGLDPGTLAVVVDGVVVTPSCVLEPGYAVCQAPALGAGAHSIAAQIRDGAGILATTEKVVEVLPYDLRAVALCRPGAGPAPLLARLDGEAITPGLPIDKYRWDFQADGTFETEQRIYPSETAHTYPTRGIHLALLEVESFDGPRVRDLCAVEVQGSPPTADAAATPSNGPVPLSVDFSCAGDDVDGPIAFYEWDFEGDGSFDHLAATSGDASHVYAVAGEFPAVCRVTDYEGMTALAPRAATTVRAGVPGSPTVTARTGATSQGPAPLFVNFRGDATDDGSIVLWEWDFEGDGIYDWSSPQWPLVTHGYTTPGIYPATLRVTDDDGNTAADAVVVSVFSTPSNLYVYDDTFSPSAGETGVVDTTLGLDTSARILIRDETGALRRTLVDELRTKGSYQDSWDGTDDAGQPVPQGPYFVEMEYQEGGETRIAGLRFVFPAPNEDLDRAPVPSSFQPFANDPLEVDFTLTSAAEVTLFIGLLNSGEGFMLLLNSEGLGAGDHRVVWDGIDPAGNLAVPPPGDLFLIGASADFYPNNTLFVSAAPALSDVTVTPNLFDPATPDYLTPQDPVATITYSLDRTADVELTVTNLDTGVVLRRIVEPMVAPGVGRTIAWDGRAADGRLADRGSYRLALRAVDASGSASLARFALVRIIH